MKRFILISMLWALTCMVAFGQTKSELEKQRAAIQQEIDEVRKTLNVTTKNKKETLGQLSLIQRKLRQRQALINNINKQIDLIQNDIYQSSRDVVKLRKELDTLKLQYEKSVVYAYKNRSNYDFLNFLFSSTSFNDAIKRVAYLRSYRNYREQQAENIANTQRQLEERIVSLNQNRKKKGEVLVEENKQRSVLEEEKKEKNTVVAKLKLRENELNKELTAKRKQDLKLKSAISAAIAREVAEARKKAELARKEREAEAKKLAGTKKTEDASPAVKTTAPVAKTTTTKPASIFDDDPASKKLSDDFEKNKGSLPWPIESGRISMAFGRQYVEGLNKVDYDNPGITIETEVGKTVKAVFEGEVATITNIGPVQCVILKHGKYFSAYSNLQSVSVSRGQKIKTGQALGKAADKGDGSAEIEFLISNEKSVNFNPEQWLR